jgi:hypothetical protein
MSVSSARQQDLVKARFRSIFLKTISSAPDTEPRTYQKLTICEENERTDLAIMTTLAKCAQN